MSTQIPLPTLYVEGKDDISVINALLSRHGVDTGRGKRHLRIEDQENVETLLLGMPVAVNQNIVEQQRRWARFREVDRIKSEIHTWLSWQRAPGAPLGAAINDHILRHDSPQAIDFLCWLKDLFEFTSV